MDGPPRLLPAGVWRRQRASKSWLAVGLTVSYVSSVHRAVPYQRKPRNSKELSFSGEEVILMCHQESEVVPVVDVLRDVAAAVRELADHAPSNPHRLLRADEVAELLQIPARTVRDRGAAEVVPHRRFGKHYRFSVSDVEEMIESMGRGPRQHGGSGGQQLRAVSHSGNRWSPFVIMWCGRGRCGGVRGQRRRSCRCARGRG
jgi:excisionase family DNA binding protein